jgi:hypothetical protein
MPGGGGDVVVALEDGAFVIGEGEECVEAGAEAGGADFEDDGAGGGGLEGVGVGFVGFTDFAVDDAGGSEGF